MLKSCKVWRLPPIPPQLLRLERSNSALCANSRNFCNELLVSEWLSEQNRWYPQSHKANVKKFSIFASSLHFAKARTLPLSWLHMVMSPWYKGSLMITKAQNDALLLKFCALPEQKLQSYVQGAKGCKGHMPHIWSSVSWCFMMFHDVSCFVDYFVNSSSFLSVRATLDALWFTGRPVPPESSASEAARFGVSTGVEIRDDLRWFEMAMDTSNGEMHGRWWGVQFNCLSETWVWEWLNSQRSFLDPNDKPEQQQEDDEEEGRRRRRRRRRRRIQSPGLPKNAT